VTSDVVGGDGREWLPARVADNRASAVGHLQVTVGGVAETSVAFSSGGDVQDGWAAHRWPVRAGGRRRSSSTGSLAMCIRGPSRVGRDRRRRTTRRTDPPLPDATAGRRQGVRARTSCCPHGLTPEEPHQEHLDLCRWGVDQPAVARHGVDERPVMSDRGRIPEEASIESASCASAHAARQRAAARSIPLAVAGAGQMGWLIGSTRGSDGR
jgi:hypothetical protein